MSDKPITQADLVKGKLILRKREFGRVVPTKQRVNIYLDQTVVDHFKRLAGNRGYQTLINQSLKDMVYRENLEVTLRKVIREELKHKTMKKAA